MLQRQGKLAEFAGQRSRLGCVVRGDTAAVLRAFQQEVGGGVQWQNVQFQAGETGGQVGQAAGQQHMAVGQARGQGGGGLQGLGRVHVVQDQQPAGIAVQPVQHGFQFDVVVGRVIAGQAERAGQFAEVGFQGFRGLGNDRQQGGVIVVMCPGILHGGAGLADAAQAVDGEVGGDGGGLPSGPGQAVAQTDQEVVAAFEQRAEGWVGQGDGFGGGGRQDGRRRRNDRRDGCGRKFHLAQDLGSSVQLGRNQNARDAGRLDMRREGGLQGLVVGVFQVGVLRLRPMIGACPADQRCQPVFAGKEILVLGVGGSGHPRRQRDGGVYRLGCFRIAATAAGADQADERLACLDMGVDHRQQS